MKLWRRILIVFSIVCAPAGAPIVSAELINTILDPPQATSLPGGIELDSSVSEGESDGGAIGARGGPTFTLPANLAVECDGAGNTAEFIAWISSATATDGSGHSLPINPVQVSAVPGCGNTIVYTYRWATFGTGGLTYSDPRTFTIQDTTGPTLILPRDQIMECDGTGNTDAFEAWRDSVIASDTCDGWDYDATWVQDSDVPGCGGTRVITGHWTSTDACDNTSISALRVFTIQDSTPPTFALPRDATVECDGAGNLDRFNAWKNGAYATDDCAGSLTATPEEVSAVPGCGNTIVYTYRWTATDGCNGTTRSATRTFTIRDTTPPTFTLPENETVECDGAGNLDAFNAWKNSATATDTCAGSLATTPVGMGGVVGCGNTIVYTYHWTATDGCTGTTNSDPRTFTIRDTTGPTFSGCPGNVTLAASSSCTAALPDLTAGIGEADACDAHPTVAQSLPSGTVLGLGANQITVTATDACNNVSQCLMTVSVVDGNKPTITCPPDLTIACNASTSPVNTGQAAATDDCDPAPSLSYADDITAGSHEGEYAIRRTWTAADKGGNTSQCIQYLAVMDSTPPAITECPASQSVQADEAGSATVPDLCSAVKAEDNCDNSPAVAQEPAPGTTVGVGQYEVTMTVIDNAGLSTTCKTTFEVLDAGAPNAQSPDQQQAELVQKLFDYLLYRMLLQSFCGVPICAPGWFMCIPPTFFGLLAMKSIRRRQASRHTRR